MPRRGVASAASPALNRAIRGGSAQAGRSARSGTPVAYEVTLPPTLVVAVDDLRWRGAGTHQHRREARLLKPPASSSTGSWLPSPGAQVTQLHPKQRHGQSRSKASQRGPCRRAAASARPRALLEEAGHEHHRHLRVAVPSSTTRASGSGPAGRGPPGRSRALLGALGARLIDVLGGHELVTEPFEQGEALGKALVVIEDEDTAQRNAPLAIGSLGLRCTAWGRVVAFAGGRSSHMIRRTVGVACAEPRATGQVRVPPVA